VKCSNGSDPSQSNGVAHNDLKIGMLVTISANKQTGDRSLVNAIWEVKGFNEGHALLTYHQFGDAEDAGKVRLVPLNEHEFYAAETLAIAARRSASSGR